jgi:hypothetical protein
MDGAAIQALAYFLGFWIFAVSRKFRQTWIERFKKSSTFDKGTMVFEASASIVIGVVLPAWLIYYLVSGSV